MNGDPSLCASSYCWSAKALLLFWERPKMKLSLIDQLIVVAYLAAIMGIGLAMKRRAAKGMNSYRFHNSLLHSMIVRNFPLR